MKCSPKGQGRTALKALMNLKNSEEQGNPNGSRKEGGKDLLRPRKQQRALWNSGANRLMQRPTAK